MKSFDFDLQISRSLFSFLLSLICASYSERESHCVLDDGTGKVVGANVGHMAPESGRDYCAPMWEVGDLWCERNQVFREIYNPF